MSPPNKLDITMNDTNNSIVKEKENKEIDSYSGTSGENLEFGGPIGATALMIWSHYILFYFWYCLETNNGQIIIPLSIESLIYHIKSFINLLLSNAIPSSQTWLAYASFFIVQLVLAATVPGLTMKGLPTSPDGKRLNYHCNGYLCYYICLFGFFLAHFIGLFPATHIADHFGELLVASMTIANSSTILWYLIGKYTKDPRNGNYKSSGSIIYDFFMGTLLYPRIGEVDIKMVAECRWSWLTLMLITSSFAVKQYQLNGYISKEMLGMIYAHWLYSNATVKGEHCIPCTWDMFHERFGWMLNFWNVCGVPFLYCFQTLYIFKNQEMLTQTNSWTYVISVYILLTIGYYVFDSANSQKAYIKIQIKRSTFPQVPWGILANPKFIHTPKGKLLISGWYKYARKLQYTGDIIMALCWGLFCGFTSPLPYFYALFFTSMIIHRQVRDEIKCKEKYGEYWDQYVKTVPNVFLPSLSFFSDLLKGKLHDD